MKRLVFPGGIVLIVLTFAGCGGGNETTNTAGGQEQNQVSATKVKPPAGLDKVAKRYLGLSPQERSKLQRASNVPRRDVLPRSAQSVSSSRQGPATPPLTYTTGGWYPSGCDETIYYFGYEVTQCYFDRYTEEGDIQRVSIQAWYKYPHYWVYDLYGILGRGSGWIQFA